MTNAEQLYNALTKARQTLDATYLMHIEADKAFVEARRTRDEAQRDYDNAEVAFIEAKIRCNAMEGK